MHKVSTKCPISKGFIHFFSFIPFFWLRFIEHYAKWLPPNHHYICDAELTLTQAIGAGDPKNLQLISDDQLQMKINLCKKLLKLFNVLAAGTKSASLQFA